MQIDLTKLAGQASTRDGLRLYPQAIVIALLFVRDFAEGQQKGQQFSVLPALCTLWLDRRQLDQLSRLDLKHRGKPSREPALSIPRRAGFFLAPRGSGSLANFGSGVAAAA